MRRAMSSRSLHVGNSRFARGVADDKGQCPGFLRPGKTSSSHGKASHSQKSSQPTEKPAPDAEYLGCITLFSAISDKGFVCDAAVQVGIDPRTDDEVLSHFKARRFPPVVQNREPVPANVIVKVDVWRKADGTIVEYPEPKLPKF